MELKALKITEFGFSGSLPDVLWDGIVNPESKTPALCIDNGESGVVNVDAGNNFSNISTDIAPHRCSLPKLAAISLPESLITKDEG